MMTKIPVLLLGCGGVGQELLLAILATRQEHALKKGLHLAVVGVMDSRSAVWSRRDKGIDDGALHRILLAKAAGLPLDSGEVRIESLELQSSDLVVVMQRIRDEFLSGDLVIVDCTASDETGDLLAEAISGGCCVVLANKKPITGSLELFDKVSASSRFRCESTVGAGLPVIVSLNRAIAAGDAVYRVIGALSGTLGYVMSGLQEGRRFSDVVQSAKALGYTEPDPRDDLSGMDVARKALIMARIMGWRITMTDVEVESMYPDNLGPAHLSITEFLDTGLPSLDAAMQARVATATSKGCVLRYVATVEDKKCKAGLVDVLKDSPLGRLSGSNNLIEIYSKCYSPSPLVIQGSGAGNKTTAAGVLADIVDLQDHFSKTVGG